MSSTGQPGRPRRFLLWVVLVLLLAAAGFIGWYWVKRRPPGLPPPLDGIGVFALSANNQGVGYMEQFKYPEAVASFEVVVRLAPDWPPGKINLGIALLNRRQETEEQGRMVPVDHQRAVALFEEVLRHDPENPYAHFCLGIILKYQNRVAEAVPHFAAVTRIDPGDASAWYRLGSCLYDDPKRAAECFRQALRLDPYLTGALYALAQNPYLREHDPDAIRSAFAEFEALKDERLDNATRGNPAGDRYGEWGRYAEVIGGPDLTPPAHTGPVPLFARSEAPPVRLAPGSRWTTSADLGDDPVGALRARVRSRFGGTMVVLDYNHDGRPDLFLLGAIVRQGAVHDLLLRNDGNGQFTDVTAEAGLDDARPSLGCCVADFDNDGWPDLFITGAGEQRLFRNTGRGGFEDVTARAGLDQLKTICLGSMFIDLDQDGDLDLVVAQYTTLDHAAEALQGDAPPPGAGLAVYLNIGEAPPAPAGGGHKDGGALQVRFRRLETGTLAGLPLPGVGPSLAAAAELAARAGLLGGAVPAVGLAASDLDRDGDLDFLALADGTAPTLVLNDRLLRFHRVPLPEPLVAPGRWNGALVLDVDHDQRSDLLLVGPGRPPALLLNQSAPGRPDAASWFQAGATNSPPLLQAQAIDLDLDGWTDVVGLSEQGKPVFLHNDGRRRLVHEADALGAESGWPDKIVALVSADFDCDGFPDLALWSESAGLQLYRSRGNGHHALPLMLTGRRAVEPTGTRVRCNADAFGARVMAQAEELWTGAEVTTLSAGLGQSRQPLLLGLGSLTQADVLRLRWPDNVWQAELNLPADQALTIPETNRKDVSCPLLFAWNGRRFGFVTDFLGAGSLGETEPGGGHRPPRPEESVKIEPEQLAPLDGRYVLKLAEPMDEVTYLDRLQLVVLDHPGDVRVYPDEHFTSSGPPATQDLLAFRQEVFPVQVRDHQGRDVTAALRSWDRDTVDDFACRAWLGLAETHWVELDFGDRLARFSPGDRLFLCLAGWTDYPYPEAIWAADQAGVALEGPTLERLDDNGKWHPVVADMGFPAGLPRLMTLEVTGLLGRPRCALRIRTNLEVYWDQVFIAPLLETVSPAAAGGTVRAACLEVNSADLSRRGFVQEFTPDGRPPTLYDYDRLAPVPVSGLAGRLTRLGDVTELLRQADDRFVIFGPGDEVTVRFDGGTLSPLPPGWKRSFVLRTWGYCKDGSPFTAAGATIEPLPFRAMSNYPYGAGEHSPNDPLHEAYRRQWNTRQAGPP